MSVNVCNELRRAKSRLSNSCLTEQAKLLAKDTNQDEPTKDSESERNNTLLTIQLKSCILVGGGW